MSPSCGKRQYLPDLRLLGKVSRNSMASLDFSVRHDDKMGNSTTSKIGGLKDEPIEIHFDPREFMNNEEGEKQENDRR